MLFTEIYCNTENNIYTVDQPGYQACFNAVTIITGAVSSSVCVEEMLLYQAT